MMRHLLLVAIVVIVTAGARSFIPIGSLATGSGAALAFGFLIIAGIHIGHSFAAMHCPRLTGYIFAGIIFGPEVFNLVTREMVSDLALVKGTAVGLIALLAGCELNLKRLRPQFRAIGTLSFFTILSSMVLLFAFFYWALGMLPMGAGLSTVQRGALALVCANVLSAFSPAVVIGVVTETRAAGPLTDLCLSTVVIADLVIVATFSISSFIARNAFPELGGTAGMLPLVVHFVGSAAAGAVFAMIVVEYVHRVNSRTGLMIFALLFLSAEIGPAFHLDPLLVGLTAGLIIENLTKVGGHHIVKAATPVALPTFAIFFSVIGAEIRLHAFLQVIPLAIGAACVRAIGIMGGTAIAARVTSMERAVARSVPLGLIPQSGVAIALAILLDSSFGPRGRLAATFVLGSIVVNEIVGPISFRAALVRRGETGAAVDVPIAESPVVAFPAEAE